MRRPLSVACLLVSAVLLAGCSDDAEEDVRRAATTIGHGAKTAAGDIRAAAQDAWSSLRTDGERLVDEIRTGDDPQAREELLEKCRDTLEKLRQAESAEAGRVDRLCNRIRETGAQDGTAWADIERELQEMNPLNVAP